MGVGVGERGQDCCTMVPDGWHLVHTFVEPVPQALQLVPKMVEPTTKSCFISYIITKI